MPVTLNANSSTGFIATSDTSSILQLQTGGTTAVTVDASQNVGIGTASPAYKLDVSGVVSSNDTVRVSGGTTVTIVSTAGGGEGVVGTSSNHALQFRTNNTERMRVNAGAPILCLSGGSTTATGTGIAFPATQSASSDANTLDDYEEGTFSPTVFGVSTAGTTTFSLRDGNYTKIGNVVTITLNVGWTNATGTGQLAIGGLPFTSINYSAVSVYNNGLAFTASNQVTAIVESGTTYISMNQFTNAGVVSSIPVDTSVARLMLSVSYLTS
jgi:hypothetical protein